LDQYIVAIGNSAGGLDALEKFFKNMKSDSGLSFVLIQHLAPDYKSMMEEHLSHRPGGISGRREQSGG